MTVEMYVRENHGDYLSLGLKPIDVAFGKGGGVHVAINFRAIVQHRNQDLRAGNAVKFAGNPDSITGVILHIIGLQAWVRWEAYDEVVTLATLERENRAQLTKEPE